MPFEAEGVIKGKAFYELVFSSRVGSDSSKLVGDIERKETRG